MGLGQRTARHETVAAAKVGARSEDFWDYRPGQRVMTSDGFPGKVVAVSDGPFAGNEEYEILLDNGMGGGRYTSSLLRSMPQTQASQEITAASDYPELGEILHERPPLAASVVASLHTAGFAPHEHPETGDYHGSEGDCRGTMCTSEHNPENDPERHAPEHVRDYANMRFDGPGAGGTIKHPTEPDTYTHGPDNFWDGPTHFKYDPDHHERLKQNRADEAASAWAGAGEPRPYRDCEHGLSADLCMGPNHYPTDEQERRGHYSSKTATDHFGDPSYTDGGTCPNCGAKGRVLKSSTGFSKCEDCGHSWGAKQGSAEPIKNSFPDGATCKDCGFGHYDKKPGDSCPLCSGQMSRMPEKHVGSLLDDPWRMLVVASRDGEFRFEVTASFADVREKAKGLRQDGLVNIISVSDGSVVANVKGEHGVYETVLTRTPGSKQSIAQWTCGCKWASYAWGRTGAYKRFEGRLCSHALAVQYEASSRGMFGRTIEEDQKSPNWLTPRTRIVTDYDKDSGRNVSRPAAPRQRDLNRTYSVKEQVGDPSPVALLVSEAMAQGEDADEVAFALHTAGIDGAPFVRIASQVTAVLPEHGDQTPCSRATCGHPEGVHGGEHTDCQAAGCECPRYAGGVGTAQRSASIDVEARHPKHHHRSHHHPHHGHSTPFRGVGHWGGWGGGYGLGGWGYGYGGYGHGGYIPSDNGQGESGGDGAGSSGDAGGGDGGSTASLHHGNAVQPSGEVDYTPWKATGVRPVDENPASAGWASQGDPKDWQVAVDNAGQRLGALDDEAIWEPEIQAESAFLAPLAPLVAPMLRAVAPTVMKQVVKKTLPKVLPGGGKEGEEEAAPAASGQMNQPYQQGMTPPAGPPPTNIEHDRDPYSLNRVMTTLNSDPEAALPSTDGVDDLDEPDLGSATASAGESVEDIVAQFQRTAGQAILSGGSTAPSEGTGDIAAMARAFLDTGQMPEDPGLTATSMKTFSPSEQRQIIDEGIDVKASNLDRLDIAGTHYEALDAALATVGDPDDDGDLWS